MKLEQLAYVENEIMRLDCCKIAEGSVVPFFRHFGPQKSGVVIQIQLKNGQSNPITETHFTYEGLQLVGNWENYEKKPVSHDDSACFYCQENDDSVGLYMVRSNSVLRAHEKCVTSSFIPMIKEAADAFTRYVVSSEI